MSRRRRRMIGGSGPAAPVAPVVANQAIDFGRLTLVGAGGATLANTGGAISSVMLGSPSVGSAHFNTSVYPLIPTSVPANVQYVYPTATATGPGGTSAPFALTINTAASAFSVKDATELAAVVALGTGTVSGKTILGRPGDYTWTDSVWASKAYSSQVTIQSHVTTRGSAPAWNSMVPGNLTSPMRLIIGSKTFTAPKNIRFKDMDFYAPFTVGVSTPNDTALLLAGMVDGLIIEDCGVYGNLSAVVAQIGLANIDGTIVWSALIGSAGGSTIESGGLTIQRCSIHDASRLIATGHDSETSGDLSVGPMLIDKNDCYNWHSDGITPLFNVSNCQIIRNSIHSPLSKLGSIIHGDAIQSIAFWSTTNTNVSRNFITMANLTGNVGTLRGHQGVFWEDVDRVLAADFFDTDVTTSKGTGWSITGGRAVYAGGGTNSQVVIEGPTGETVISGQTYKTVITISEITNSTGNVVLRARRLAGGDPHSATFALSSVVLGAEIEMEWIAGSTNTDYGFVIEASSPSAAFKVDFIVTVRDHARTNADFTMNFIMANQNAGLSAYNDINGRIVGNSVIGRADWLTAEGADALPPRIASARDWYGEGGGNIVTDNTAYGISTDWATDILSNNITVDFTNPTAVSAAYTTPPSTIDGMTIPNIILGYTQKTGGPLDTPIPKPTATAYVDWTSVDRPWDHPRLNVVDPFTVTDLTSQVISTQVTSAATQITNIDKSDGATSVNGALVWIDTLNSTLVSPQFRITSDAGGSSVITNWTSTPAIIQQGQYLWVRGTSSGSAATATTVKIYVGPTFDTWSVTTAAAGVTFTSVAFDGTNDWLTRGANFGGLIDGEEFTFVCRINPTDTGAIRVLFRDAQDNILIFLNTANQLQGYMYGAAQRIGFSTSSTIVNADGMITLFASGRTTSGSEVFQLYKDGTSMAPTVSTLVAGTMDFTPTDWGIFADVAGTGKYTGNVEFVWFDNIRYDLSSSTVRDKWLAANINADGSGPGAQPKLFKYGNAAAWNASPVVNLGTGGNLIMHGAVS